MRTLLVVFCALLVMGTSLEAKRKSPKSHVTKDQKAMMKKLQKARKAPKHRQKVN